jgi:hypothetical protein
MLDVESECTYGLLGHVLKYNVDGCLMASQQVRSRGSHRAKSINVSSSPSLGYPATTFLVVSAEATKMLTKTVTPSTFPTQAQAKITTEFAQRTYITYSSTTDCFTTK